ncbi:hypothetical protein SPAR_30771 [Streptomyces sparsogenes DSM 40356]|uniref:Uncharacterized protein n=1 Tax=Streptomyces sparsogenes DSM 40356 TaxID=1331668 RepID=A0A1R1SB03_9ACTN|nr:hypothetical protein SPAR_30771 [Streptomyces sparsogenes DSM 40356]
MGAAWASVAMTSDMAAVPATRPRTVRDARKVCERVRGISLPLVVRVPERRTGSGAAGGFGPWG